MESGGTEVEPFAGFRKEECRLCHFARYSRVDRSCSPCEAQEVVVKLFGYTRQYRVRESKAQILSEKILLDNNELYTMKTHECE